MTYECRMQLQRGESMVYDQLAKCLTNADKTTGVVGVIKLIVREVEFVERKLALCVGISAVDNGYLHSTC